MSIGIETLARLLINDKVIVETRRDREKRKTALDLVRFLADIAAHLKATKFEAGNTIEHRGLYGREIPEFLKDVFPEITDQVNFLAVLKIFGLKQSRFSDAYVFFDREKTGFIMAQQPIGIHPVDQSHFCLLYQIKGKNKTPVVNIAGVYQGRILTAIYRFQPESGQYIRRCLDIGVNQDEHPHKSMLVNDGYLGLHPWLTTAMRMKAPLRQNIVSIKGETAPKIFSPGVNSIISKIPARLLTSSHNLSGETKAG